MTSSATVDPRLCPLCGLSNQCANEVERATGIAQPPCWCTQTTFDAALLSRVPADAKGKACICPACARTLTSSCAVTPG